MNETMRTIHLQITGRVQGVYYRAWTAQQAEALGLSGWVRNRRDRSVEAVFHGPADKVSEMLGLCREGPADALVEDVKIIQEGGAGATGFEIRPTV